LDSSSEERCSQVGALVPFPAGWPALQVSRGALAGHISLNTATPRQGFLLASTLLAARRLTARLDARTTAASSLMACVEETGSWWRGLVPTRREDLRSISWITGEARQGGGGGACCH
jgi:hypothetical protein